jgi:hypothetical protein
MSLDELQRLARAIAVRGANAIEAAPGLAAAAEQFLPAEGLIHLLNGRLLIPPWALEAELRAVLRSRVRLVGLTCCPDGLHLELEVAAWGGWARLAASVVLSVELVIVSDAGQRAAVRLRPVGLRGRNLAGRFATVLARIRWRGTGGFPPTSAWLTSGTSAEVRLDPYDPNRIKINLSSHPMISRLHTARIAGQPLLRWIKVVGCRHTPEGLLLQGVINPSDLALA